MKKKMQKEYKICIFCKRHQSQDTPETTSLTIENPEITSMQTLQKIFIAGNPCLQGKCNIYPANGNNHNIEEL